MPFKNKPQVFSAKINTLELGTGDQKIALGGENVYNFYTFDAACDNPPRVGVEISDLGLWDNAPEGLKEFYADASTPTQMAKKAEAMEGADFVALSFEGADPNGANKTIDECVAVAREVADAIEKPLVVMGCKNAEKDAQLFDKIAEALQGKNVLFLSAKEENYKTVGASAGLAYGQKVGAESSVDINLAKQLNVLISQLGVASQNTAMNVGSATAGYGFEYVVSTMERVKAAALTQDDKMLQMPIITPVSSETWNVKESVATEEDMPEWGCREARGVNMEVVTASAVLAAGSNAVILRHPKSVATVSAMIAALM